jgi:hypothetical protein
MLRLAATACSRSAGVGVAQPDTAADRIAATTSALLVLIKAFLIFSYSAYRNRKTAASPYSMSTEQRLSITRSSSYPPA